MSPASLRRYRAERLLREEFHSLRASVIAIARCKLRAYGAELDEDDLEAAYGQAWQGLYLVTLAGEEVTDRAAWLVVATFRRAIDEHRAARRRRELVAAQLSSAAPQLPVAAPGEPDPADELDRRLKLRRLFEALRLRLSARERRAFALCYLQGLSRAEAAAAMGLSERRMRKLMDGRGAGDAGTTAKVSALAHTIRAEKWCDEQGSLMRGFAYGVLDPHGERHRLAVMHTQACPACRSYVASLRGLAALLPPVPGVLSLLAAASGAARDATRNAAARTHFHTAAAARGSGGVAAPAAAASTTGAAGGGWLVIGGGASAKLAATCLLALGLGAGCAVLTAPGSASHRRPGSRQRIDAARARVRAHAATSAESLAGPRAAASSVAAPTGAGNFESALTPAARASREFGPEQAAAAISEASPSGRSNAARASAAAREFSGAAPSPRRAAAPTLAANPVPAAETAHAESVPSGAASTGEAQAQREFSPG
jgi:RNA polymerase sigma factor (sigma-70 family)